VTTVCSDKGKTPPNSSFRTDLFFFGVVLYEMGINSADDNLNVPDPECDLDAAPDKGRNAEIEHAVCICIAFGSKNSAIVLRRL